MTYSSKELSKLLPEKMELEHTDIAETISRNGYTNNQERVLRVLSWLTAAEKADDDDVCLMCALAAFNGLYAVPRQLKKISIEHKKAVQDHEIMDPMIDKLIEFDEYDILLKYLKNEQRDDLEKILTNQYLFFGYWKFYETCKNMPVTSWMKAHGENNEEIEKLLANDDVALPLKEIMHRIWALRNQLLHGEAGYKDYYNRSQIKACANFLPPLVGRMLRIMINNNDFLWGKVPYPPQGKKPNAVMHQFKSLADKKRTK